MGGGYISGLSYRFDFDWIDLNIPLEHAVITIKGRGVSHFDIKPEQVDEVRFGYGYRKYLVYKVNRDAPLGDKERLFSNPSVICR